MMWIQDHCVPEGGQGGRHRGGMAGHATKRGRDLGTPWGRCTAVDVGILIVANIIVQDDLGLGLIGHMPNQSCHRTCPTVLGSE